MDVPGRLLALCSWLVAAWCGAGPLDFNGSPADSIVVTFGPDAPPDATVESLMVDSLTGVAARVDPRARHALAALGRRAPEVGWPEELAIRGYVHVAFGGERRSFAVGRTGDGLVLLRPVGAGADDGPSYEFPAEPFAGLLRSLGGYRGPFSGEGPLEPGVVGSLPPPYVVSPFLLDEQGIRRRLMNGRMSELAETERLLSDELLFVRLPEGYTPARPWGVLVWIDATHDGRPPEVLFDAADKLGLILLGAANIGNTRPVVDRYQIALDAAATGHGRLHTDPSRCYVTGLSGGGRVSSTLVACYPDVFTGSVPIVGIFTHEPVPLGDGRFVRAGYMRPDAERLRLLREHRIAAMSGPLDFNYREIVNAVRILERSGLDARLFEYEDMAHTLPTAERFTEAMSWVDEPARDAIAEREGRAAELMAGYTAKYGDVPVATEPQRRMLAAVIEAGPWTPAAWRACGLLGLVDSTGRPAE